MSRKLVLDRKSSGCSPIHLGPLPVHAGNETRNVMKIAQKLAIIVMGGSILASAAIGIVSYRIAANELQTAAAKTLVALREARAAEFQRYLNSIQGDLDLNGIPKTYCGTLP